MITPNDPFRSEPRISRDKFAQIVREQAAPGVSAERDPVAYWDKIKEYGVDPLFVLAMFNHESSMGKAGVARTTHSWGNTRAPSFGAKPIGETPGASGTFPIFRDWLDGCASTAARMVAPDWVYAKRRTIRDIFDWPPDQTLVWAPAGDFNNPAGYLRAVIDFMNDHADGGQATAPRIPRPPFLTDIRATTYGGYDQPRIIEAICIHTSGGYEQGDLTQLTKVVSANVYINKKGVIRLLVDAADAAWTNGQWGNPNLNNPLIAKWFKAGINPNTRTLTIECEDLDHQGYLTMAQHASLVWVCAYWCETYNIPIDRTHIIGHYEIDSVKRSYCPGFSDSEWHDLIADIAAYGAVQPPTDAFTIPGNPFGNYGFRHGFRATVEALAKAKYPADINAAALSITGYPKEDEWAGVDGCSYQRCERVTLQWHPSNGAPFDIVFLLPTTPLPEAKP